MCRKSSLVVLGVEWTDVMWCDVMWYGLLATRKNDTVVNSFVHDVALQLIFLSNQYYLYKPSDDWLIFCFLSRVLRSQRKTRIVLRLCAGVKTKIISNAFMDSRKRSADSKCTRKRNEEKTWERNSISIRILRQMIITLRHWSPEKLERAMRNKREQIDETVELIDVQGQQKNTNNSGIVSPDRVSNVE